MWAGYFANVSSATRGLSLSISSFWLPTRQACGQELSLPPMFSRTLPRVSNAIEMSTAVHIRASSPPASDAADASGTEQAKILFGEGKASAAAAGYQELENEKAYA